MKMKFLNSRRFKHGSMATVITVGFIILVILVNVIATLVLERFPLTIDLTADKRFGITQETIDFLGKTTEAVTVYVCYDEQLLSSGQNELYKQAYEIIKGYPRYASSIKIEFIDLVKNPSFAKQHQEETFVQGDIYVKSALRGKKVTFSDMFESNQSQETGETTYRSQAEQVMTTAIDYVTDQTPTSAILLTGLDNVDTSGYVSLLKTNNISIIEKNLLTEEMDKEAAFVIFPQPSADITAEQADRLDAYLDNDAKFGKSLIFIASQDREIGPVLKAWLAEWGMEIGNSTIVETNPSNVYQNSPFLILNQNQNEAFVTALNTTQPVLSPNAKPITTLFEKSDNRETKVLTKTFETSVLIPADAKEDFDFMSQPQSSFNTMVMCSRLKYDGTTPQTSNVIAVSSEGMFANAFLTYPGFGNGNAALAVTSMITPKKDSVQIVPVVFANDSITINQGQVVTNRILFTMVIPILVAGCGLVIWLRRRHL